MEKFDIGDNILLIKDIEVSSLRDTIIINNGTKGTVKSIWREDSNKIYIKVKFEDITGFVLVRKNWIKKENRINIGEDNIKQNPQQHRIWFNKNRA